MDDDELVLLTRARVLDETALAAIFDAYYAPIYRYLYFHTGHAQTAEDLSALVFRRLLDALVENRGPDHHLKAWLFRVAARLVVDDARRAQHRDHLVLDEAISADDHSLEEAVQAQLRLAELRAALDDLTDSQRSVIILRYLLELSNEETADIMQMSVGAVKAQQHRALVALRAKLKEDNREQSA